MEPKIFWVCGCRQGLGQETKVGLLRSERSLIIFWGESQGQYRMLVYTTVIVLILMGDWCGEDITDTESAEVAGAGKRWQSNKQGVVQCFNLCKKNRFS